MKDLIKKNGDRIFIIFLYSLLLSTNIQSLVALFQLFGLMDPNNEYFKITGLFINPAPLAMYLAISFSFIVTFLYYLNTMKKTGVWISDKIINESFYKKYHFIKTWATCTIIPILFLLPLSKNRTSWVMAIGVLLFILLKEKRRIIYKLKAANFTVPVIIILLVSLFFFGKFIYQYKENSSKGRILIAKVSLSKLNSVLFNGFGYGNFDNFYNVWQSEWFSQNPKKKMTKEGYIAGDVSFAYNILIEKLLETGLLGLLIYSILLTQILLTKIYDNLSWCFKSVLGVLIIATFISYPHKILPINIVGIIMLAFINTRDERNKEPIQAGKIKFIFTAMQIVFIYYSLIALSLYYYSYLNWYNHSFRKHFLKGEYYSYIVANQSFEIPLEEYYVFLFYQAVAFEKVGAHQSAVELLKTVNTIHPNYYSYLKLGDIYLKINQFTLAEQAYQVAENMIPNYIEPRYKKAIIYLKIKNYQKLNCEIENINNTNFKGDSSKINLIKKSLLNEITNLQKDK